MNRRHSRVTDWGLQQVAIREHDTILDVGCGGGRTVAKLDLPSATMAQLNCAEIDSVARSLDEKIQHLLDETTRGT
jgi:2-polyprenyl-3-methyl-5-hydroxy-6-metoxy-1,4-benzoquinol methylase